MDALPFEHQPSWVIKAVSNGCGGKGSLIDPPEGKYGGCCDKHDFLYTVGGEEIDRTKADGEFLVDMIKIVVVQRAGLMRLLMLLMAILYFYGVHFAGKRFFRYGPKLSQEELEAYAKEQAEIELALITDDEDMGLEILKDHPPVTPYPPEGKGDLAELIVTGKL